MFCASAVRRYQAENLPAETDNLERPSQLWFSKWQVRSNAKHILLSTNHLSITLSSHYHHIIIMFSLVHSLAATKLAFRIVSPCADAFATRVRGSIGDCIDFRALTLRALECSRARGCRKSPVFGVLVILVILQYPSSIFIFLYQSPSIFISSVSSFFKLSKRSHTMLEWLQAEAKSDIHKKNAAAGHAAMAIVTPR